MCYLSPEFCLSARQGLGNVSPAFRLLTLTDVRYWPDRNVRRFARLNDLSRVYREHLPAMESGVPDIDYNADNIYVYIYITSLMAIYSYICFWSGINSRNFCVLQSVKGKKKKIEPNRIFSSVLQANAT